MSQNRDSIEMIGINILRVHFLDKSDVAGDTANDFFLRIAKIKYPIVAVGMLSTSEEIDTVWCKYHT